MNNNDKCRSNNNSPRAVMIHGVPVKTYNALQNHIIVLLCSPFVVPKVKVFYISYMIVITMSPLFIGGSSSKSKIHVFMHLLSLILL